jgi:hypothetical protein
MSGEGIRRLAFVVQEVHAAHGSHDAAGPSIQFALEQWRWAFAGQLLGQLAAKHGVFFV